MAERPVRAEAARPDRQPADPVPPPRVAAARGPARGHDRARPRGDAGDDRGGCRRRLPLGADGPLRRAGSPRRAWAARCAARARSSATSRCSSSPADALHREQIHPHIAAFADGAAGRDGAHDLGRGRRAGASPAATCSAVARSRSLLDEPGAHADPWRGVRAAAAARSGSSTSTAACRATAARTGCSRATAGCSSSSRPDVDAAAFPTCEFQGPVLVHPTAHARAHARPRTGRRSARAPGCRMRTSARTPRSAPT